MTDKKILVVDDSEEFIFLLSSLLKFHKIEVDAESNPIIAFDKTQATDYALIISDYMMDEMDGLTLCRKIIKDGKDFNGSIILLTAKNLDETEVSQVNELGLTYIRKPIMPNELHKKVLSLLE